MQNKALIGLCCISAFLSGCDGSNKVTEQDRDQRVTLIKNKVAYSNGGVWVQMDFDSDNDPDTTEYRGIDFHDETIPGMAEYASEMKKIKEGTRGTIRAWEKIIPNIFIYEKSDSR